MNLPNGYVISWVTKLFHSFPHVDLTINHVDSTLDLEDARYREVLVFWAAIPVLWLLLTLLTFLIYFFYRCCQRDVEKKQRVPCLKWTMAVHTFFTIACIGVGFYGNENVRQGINQFTTSANSAQYTVTSVKNQMAVLDSSINGSADRGLGSIDQFLQSSSAQINASSQADLERLLRKSRDYSYAVLAETKKIHEKTENIEFNTHLDTVTEYEFYRWVAMLVYFGWMTLLCLLLLIAIARSSKCTLLSFCAFGVFTLVLCWMMAGLHTSAGVGLADFCFDPDTFIKTLQKEDLDQDVLSYYMECSLANESPFRESLQQASHSLRQSNITFMKLLSLTDSLNIDRQPAQPYVDLVEQALSDSSNVLLTVTALVDCINLHKDYTRSIQGLCSMALPGVALMLLSCVMCGFLFTLLVILASWAWRHFSRRKGYDTVDTEDDPFLPRPDNGNYYSFTRSGRPPQTRPGAADNSGSMQRRPTPPPAYNTYDYRDEMTPPPPGAAPMASHEHYHTFGRGDSRA